MYKLVWYSVGSVSAWLFIESKNAEKNAEKLFKDWNKKRCGKYVYTIMPGFFNFSDIETYTEQKGGFANEIKAIDYNGIKIIF